MSTPRSAEDALELAEENSINEQYMEALSRKDLTGVVRANFSAPRSSSWTKTGEPRVPGPNPAPLIGRVRLDCHDSDVEGDNYYIGPWHLQDGDICVFSWAAPVAETFFRGQAADHQFGKNVKLSRTLLSRNEQIIEFTDQWVKGHQERPAFPKRQSLQIPTPPPVPTPPKAELPRPAALKPPPAPPTQPRSETTSPEQKPRPHTRPAIRAEDAVRITLAAPRADKLTSVLATLQPEQYDLVTASPDTSLVIQGHPGTGKTIIAAHRAAYLVNPEREGSRRLNRVLLVGPTGQYERHVQGIVRELEPSGTVVVRGLLPWLNEMALLKRSGGGAADGTLSDVDDWVFGHVQLAAQKLRYWCRTYLERAGAPNTRKARDEAALARAVLEQQTTQRTLERLYTALRENRVGADSITGVSERRQWARTLPTFEGALKLRRYAPLLAACSLALRPVGKTNRFDHIIVDEAQDLRPLEWQIINAHCSGEWTLIGDLNQRRTDHSYGSWKQVADALAVSEDGQELRIADLKRGYRSTGPIMRYANKLLAKSDRVLESIQTEGPDPVVVRVDVKDLPDRSISLAEELLVKYGAGTTAIISVEPAAIIGALRKRGWEGASASDYRWRKDSMQLSVMVPDAARGLEFDAVVVVEPGGFPKNFGRQGPLFTSLTRANRELAVLHALPLPNALR